MSEPTHIPNSNAALLRAHFEASAWR